ncbi:hypothetical protein OPT61_g3070 [Boeremia exigua]|uniref:Uncharacterized protein n=1 Tax=Boeremia exigua TaxID=749465 RepID=A0ACC2IJE7_9PLEO|nr:hypothetical protein OPT61_g3070 [Boeremia exigua]
MTSTLILASFFGFAAAQSTTLSLPFYVFGTQSIDASIVSANQSATTMALACPPGTDSNDCGLFPEMTLVYGPSTYHLDMGVGNADSFTGTADCVRGGATVTCTEFATGSEANFPGRSTTTYAGEDIVTLPVTVTSGAEKLGGAQTTATESANPSGSTSGPSGQSSGSTASVTQIVGTNTAPASSVSRTPSASATPSTGASPAKSIAFKGGLVGAVVGLVGGLLL